MVTVSGRIVKKSGRGNYVVARAGQDSQGQLEVQSPGDFKIGENVLIDLDPKAGNKVLGMRKKD